MPVLFVIPTVYVPVLFILIEWLVIGDPKNYFARSTLAYANYVLANYAEAEKQYESLIVDYPADTEMQIGLGWSLLKQGNKAKAKTIFAALTKIIPKEERVSSGAYYANN